MDLNNYPLWTAVITPMLDNGEVDYESLERVLNQQVEAMNGLLILGSTGEALNLDLSEQKEILDFTLSLNLKAPIMVGVGGINLRETTEWIKYLESLDVHCYLLVTPLYAKPGTIGQYEWFQTLMDTSSRPVNLYNIPSRTGLALSHKTVQMLKDHPNLWAIKEASGSVDEFKLYVADAPKAKVFSGDDALLPVFSKVGAKGLISVSSNSWPAQTHLYTEQCLDGKLSDGDQRLWADCTNTMFIASNPIPVKRLMYEQGTIKTSVLRAPLTHRDLENADRLLTADEKINTWYKNQ